MRPYRSHGPNGPAIYPQCLPGPGHVPHLLAWLEASPDTRQRKHDASRPLSKSELELLIDASEGCSAQESAARRYKGRETIKTHRSQVLVKLGARNMTQAVALAMMNRLIPGRKAA